MASPDTVEKLRARAGVTYDEASEALNRSDGDILDALLWLEKNGKTEPPRVSYYTTDKARGPGADDYGAASKDKARKRAAGSDGGRYYDGEGNSDTRYDDRRSNGYKRAYYYDENDSRARASAYAKTAGGFVKKAFKIGNTTLFEITRHGDDIIKIPLTLLIVGFVMLFHVALVLLPLGLFFGFRYQVSGNSIDGRPVNSILNTAADAVEWIKKTFRSKS